MPAEVSEQNKGNVEAVIGDLNRIVDERAAAKVAEKQAEIDQLRQVNTAVEQRIVEAKIEGESAVVAAIKSAFGIF